MCVNLDLVLEIIYVNRTIQSRSIILVNITKLGQSKKSRIRETPNLSTDADSSTDTCFPPAAVCHVSHVTCHMGKFFCNFRNICTIKSFLMK